MTPSTVSPIATRPAPGSDSRRRGQLAGEAEPLDQHRPGALVGRGDDVAVGCDEPRDAVRRGDRDPAAGLHRAQPGDRELLVGLVGVDEGGLAALHHQQLGTVAELGGETVVVGDVEADRVGHLHPVDVERLATGAAQHVAADLAEPVEEVVLGEDGAERDVLAERHRVPLGVAVAGAGLRVPDDALVEHLLGARAVDDRAHQDRYADRRARGPDPGVGLGVVEGVDGRGVLRPDDEVRLRDLPGLHLPGEVDRGVHVVLGDLAIVVEDVVPVAGHVALHRGHGDLAVGRGRPRHQGRDGEQGHQPDQAERRHLAAPLPRDRAADQPRQQRAEQGEEEADADRAGVRQRLGDGRVHDPEREPAPRHPAQWPAAAPDLHGGPRRGEPQRPEPVPLEDRRERTRQAVEQGLQRRQHEPGRDPDRAHPVDVGEVEGGAEAEADDEAAPQPTARGS